MSLEADSQDLITAILSKDWSELEALEVNGELLFPDELVRKRADGKWERTPVMLKVPREPDMRAARIKAREWAKEIGLDPDLDPELFSNMDDMCVLSIAIRNSKAPYEPMEPFADKLESRWDRPCLDAIYAKLDAYRTVIDPRPEALTEEQLLGIIAAVAKARNIVPLAAFAGQSQNSCVVTMAVQLQKLLDSK